MTEETLFHLALQQPPAERAAFLEKMCGADYILRERVEALLYAADHPGDFLQQTLVKLDTTAVAGSLTEGPGSRIGSYKLLQPIGEGGMGIVFMAEQLEPVRRLVALKVLKLGMDSRFVLARSEAERQALALMDHPNIAKVFDAGITDSGHPYFVMELVKGILVTKYCDEHRLTLKERLQLFVPICRAVQHAHQKGIIHRDIKPSNVLVALYDGQPVPKVIDFGVAKATGGRLTEKTLFTDFGAVVGTLEYMSPEQAELNQLDIDTRADIHALGVLLYELLTGTTPLERKRLREASILELLRVIREEEPPKPSTRLSTTEELPSIAAKRGLEPNKLSGLVRGDLDWIVMKCLEKDRNRRYETANGLALDVQHYLADEPVLASPPSAWYRLRKFGRRHKSGLLTTVAVGIVVLLACGGLGWEQWQQAAQRESYRIEQAGRVAETERAVTVALAKAEQSEERAKRLPCTTSVEARAALAEWREAAAGLAEAEAALTTGAAPGELRGHVAEVRQRIEQGRTRTRRQEQLFRDLDEASVASLVWVDNHLDRAGAAAKYAAAFAAYDLDIAPEHTAELARRIRAEEPAVRDALLVALDDWAAMVKPIQTKWSVTDLRAIAEAADDDVWRQRFRAAVAAGNGAALRDLSAEARRSSLRPSSLVRLASSLVFHDQRDEAIALLRWGRRRHPTDFWLHLELASCLLGSQNATPVEIEEMMGCCRVVLVLRPETIAARFYLARGLRYQKQLDEAIAELHQAIEINPKVAVLYIDLGVTLREKNQWDEALAEIHQALAIDPKYAPAYDQLGWTLRLQGKLDEAVRACRKAVELQPRAPTFHNSLGCALRDQGKLDEASAEFGQAIAHNSKYAPAHHNLGLVLADQNQWDEALVEFRQALAIDPKYAAARYNLAKAERMVAMQDKLPAFLKGEYQPRDNDERLALAQVCKAKQLYRAATGLYADALAANPRLAQHYNAAHCAVLAAAGQGADADKIDDQDHARLRKQALAWLRADLELWSKRLESGKSKDRQVTRANLQHWQRDADLAGVRDGETLTKLPADEQQAWRKLWAEVAELLMKAGDAK